MRKLAVAAALCGGCSWIFMERVPGDHRQGSPVHCSASKGWAAWDSLNVVLHGLAAVGTAYYADGRPAVLVVTAGHVALTVGHLISATNGFQWADECRDTRGAVRDQIVVVPQAPRPTTPRSDRKIVEGERPLFCAIESEDVGLCFLDEHACSVESAKTAIACEQRNAGSCFNATKRLDGTKQTICAISIKDCESRRAVRAADPDFAVTNCGIYRAR